ncbi:hypothetical protein DLM45_06640 [Hyphomicrobium methylovorum]|uniref:hypothetical protein n=1 Tax=Hyphomicrobium methylovorum TaxID=84 RepID=UPI0015E79557|nr:hypothetical protein [Hyphomicrobium methylovorum]MBA2125900.1 hypothetical protein [Hyphomicrobium methylovorum]
MATTSQQDTHNTVKDLTGQAKAAIDSTADTVHDAAREARRHVGAVGGNFNTALDKSLKNQPYTTLVMAGLVGLVVGALWKS